MSVACAIHLLMHSLTIISFQECLRYISSMEINNFLDGAIRNRISVRLIAEQHIALSQALDNPEASAFHVGVVDLKCSPKAMIGMCGSFVSELCEATLGASPSIVIDGDTDATFACVSPCCVFRVLTTPSPSSNQLRSSSS